jgi:hypothetical protein
MLESLVIWACLGQHTPFKWNDLEGEQPVAPPPDGPRVVRLPHGVHALLW